MEMGGTASLKCRGGRKGITKGVSGSGCNSTQREGVLRREDAVNGERCLNEVGGGFKGHEHEGVSSDSSEKAIENLSNVEGLQDIAAAGKSKEMADEKVMKTNKGKQSAEEQDAEDGFREVSSPFQMLSNNFFSYKHVSLEESGMVRPMEKENDSSSFKVGERVDETLPMSDCNCRKESVEEVPRSVADGRDTGDVGMIMNMEEIKLGNENTTGENGQEKVEEVLNLVRTEVRKRGRGRSRKTLVQKETKVSGGLMDGEGEKLIG